jgi:hypothetical protein
MSAAVIATLIAVVLMCAIAYVLLGWADSGALDTAVRCDHCRTSIRLTTDEDRDAYLRGLEQGHELCPDCAPEPAVSPYPVCAASACTATWDGTCYVCAVCGRPMAIGEAS